MIITFSIARTNGQPHTERVDVPSIAEGYARSAGATAIAELLAVMVRRLNAETQVAAESLADGIVITVTTPAGTISTAEHLDLTRVAVDGAIGQFTSAREQLQA